MQILHRIINRQNQPLITTDISGNHEQDFQKALKLIQATKDAGCDAVKFQTYTPDCMTGKGFGTYKQWEMYELYKNICTPLEWHKELFAYAKSINLIAFTSVFHPSHVEFLEKLDCPAYKISSYEVKYLDLLNAVKETGKPIIISTGCASYSDLAFISTRFSAINTMFLKSVASYPAEAKDFNLLTIPDMRQAFGMEIGLSDHSLGSAIAVTAVALGATMIEKHITLERSAIDGYFALTPDEMSHFVTDIHDSYDSLGQVDYTNPGKNKKYMRSIWSIKDIKKGELFTRQNVAILRPNDGLCCTQINNVIDRRAREDIKYGTAIHLRHIE